MLEADFGCRSAPCQQWQDVVAELPAEIAAQLLPPQPKKGEAENLINQLSLFAEDLSATEHDVWKLLSTLDPSHIDALAVAGKMPVS